MCENETIFEAAMIYSIPTKNYDLLSSGWFAANHPCSSIFIPVHICDNDIYEPYKNGKAAALSLELLERYGHNNLSIFFSKIENVLLFENRFREELSKDFIENISKTSIFLTNVDISMQYQAWLMENMWLETSNISDVEVQNEVISIISDIWYKNYSLTLDLMENAVLALDNISEYAPEIDVIIGIIGDIIQSIDMLMINKI
jgi:hypothetical protein